MLSENTIFQVQYIFKSGDTNVFWFFFPYVYIANFMLTPILIAITNIRLETFLLDNLKKMAKRKSGNAPFVIDSK